MNESLHLLTGAYAVGALDPAELVLVEGELAKWSRIVKAIPPQPN